MPLSAVYSSAKVSRQADVTRGSSDVLSCTAAFSATRLLKQACQEKIFKHAPVFRRMIEL
jgi:hypothetical protein